MSFGTVLKALRYKRGITQAVLAKELDVPEPSIRRWEVTDGVPRMDRLKQIAQYFGVTTDFLLEGDTDVNSGEESEEALDKKYLINLVDGIQDPAQRKAAIVVLESLSRKR